MISVRDSHIEIKGSFGELCTDFIRLFNAFYDFLNEVFSEEESNEIIAALGKVAVLDDDNFDEKSKEIILNSPLGKELRL